MIFKCFEWKGNQAALNPVNAFDITGKKPGMFADKKLKKIYRTIEQREKRERKKSKEIEEQIKSERLSTRNLLTVSVLGGKNSGKSTLMKKLQVLTNSELEKLSKTVQTSLVKYVKEALRDYIALIGKNSFTEKYFEEFEKIEQLELGRQAELVSMFLKQNFVEELGEKREYVDINHLK